MMSLIPYRRVNSIFDDLDAFFDNTLGRRTGSCLPTVGKTASWSPAVDVEEKEDRFLVKADIPGVEPKEVEVSLENGVLSIKGERSEKKEETKDGYRRVERVSGCFSRSFVLPDDVNAEAITASGKNGVLEIEIPKSEKKKPKRIEVH